MMNKHLNIFKTYTKKNRSYQLENDLTRALAICLQEDALFFHEVLKTIINDSGLYNKLFEDLDGDTEVQIEIQKRTSQVDEFDKIFAVSLSESVMSGFWQQKHNTEYDPICDLVITINNILIVIEAKRDNINCTSQLYNQILNVLSYQNKCLDDSREVVTPVDLNWRKLMAIAVKVASFEKTTSNTNRFLNDFIQLVKEHNFSWLPETPIGSLKNINAKSISRRIESAIIKFCDNSELVEKLTYRDRLGTTFTPKWANELLFDINAETGELVVEIYPGNTKGQGYHIFQSEPQFSQQLKIDGELYAIEKSYHIKIMGQSYITGLWLAEDDFKKNLYTKRNFNQYTGRVRKESWKDTEALLDEHISCDWRSKCKWEDKILKSNRTRFDISFGYLIKIKIPFERLSQLDVDHNDITPLANLIESIYKAFETSLLIKEPLI